MHVLSREVNGNHHHPPTAGPVDNRPEVGAVQYMPGNTHLSVRPPHVTPHFVVRVDEPYIRVPVDGFLCGEEVDNLADGPVDQLSTDEILKSPLIKFWRVSDPRGLPTLMSMT